MKPIRLVKRSCAIRSGIPQRMWAVAVKSGRLRPAVAGGKFYHAAAVEAACGCKEGSIV